MPALLLSFQIRQSVSRCFSASSPPTAGVLLWTHGFWGLFTGAGLGSERRRRARGGAKPLAPLAFFGGGLGIRLQAARLLGAAVQRRVNKWRSDARRKRAQKLG